MAIHIPNPTFFSRLLFIEMFLPWITSKLDICLDISVVCRSDVKIGHLQSSLKQFPVDNRYGTLPGEAHYSHQTNWDDNLQATFAILGIAPNEMVRIT